MVAIPDYVVARLRSAVPDGCCVVSGSTPVVAFGDCRWATVATLGLNPSRREFLTQDGSELAESDRRFETLRSLGVAALDEADDSALDRVFSGCCNYFSRRPYRRWFDQLETLLRPIGASYYDGTACHLDLVQWATDPVWRRLDRLSVRRRLLNSDAPFLFEQLRQGRIRVLLLNGRTVVNEFEAAAATRLDDVGRLSGPLHARSRVVARDIEGGLLAVGWTVNLQSSFGVTSELRAELGATIAKTVLDGRLGLEPGDV